MLHKTLADLILEKNHVLIRQHDVNPVLILGSFSPSSHTNKDIHVSRLNIFASIQ